MIALCAYRVGVARIGKSHRIVFGNAFRFKDAPISFNANLDLAGKGRGGRRWKELNRSVRLNDFVVARHGSSIAAQWR